MSLETSVCNNRPLETRVLLAGVFVRQGCQQQDSTGSGSHDGRVVPHGSGGQRPEIQVSVGWILRRQLPLTCTWLPSHRVLTWSVFHTRLWPNCLLDVLQKTGGPSREHDVPALFHGHVPERGHPRSQTQSPTVAPWGGLPGKGLHCI